MLRLLIVALPVVVALLVAFDEQEANALRFEVQSPLQFAGVATPALATGPSHRRMTPASPHSVTSARADLHHAMGSASQRLCYTFIYTAHTTHSRHRLHSQPACPPKPEPQLTRFSCLRAALARQDLPAS